MRDAFEAAPQRIGLAIARSLNRAAESAAVAVSRELAKENANSVRTAEFSGDGKHIVTASMDKTARIWDAQSGKEITILKSHNSWVFTAAFSGDGKRVVTASEDRTARIWNVTWAALTRGNTDAPAKHNNKTGGRGSTGTVA